MEMSTPEGMGSKKKRTIKFCCLLIAKEMADRHLMLFFSILAVISGKRMSFFCMIPKTKQSLEASESKVAIIGPWGGQEGFRWDDGMYSSVRQLVITHGAGIDSIQIEYDLMGSSVWSEQHGESKGTKIDKVKLDYPDEYLTSIHGHYGSLLERGLVIVRSLTLESNRKTYGPFGEEKGSHFSFPVTGGKIMGFHGRSGWYLDAIGVYLKPCKNRKEPEDLTKKASNLASFTNRNSCSIMQGSLGQTFDILPAVRHKEDGSNSFGRKYSRESNGDSIEVESNEKRMVTEKAPQRLEGLVTCRPWGGSGGVTFDDGAYTGVRQINLCRNVGIVSIKVLYDLEGQAIWGSKHGGTGAYKYDMILLEYPNEILTHITGTIGPVMYMGPNVVRSITFHTNKGKHGPFGEEQGASFTSRVKEGKIVGFHGRNGLFLDAIGVHIVERKVPAMTRHPSSNLTNKGDAEVVGFEYPQWSSKLVLARQPPAEEVAHGIVQEPAPCGPGPWGGDGGRPWDDGVFSGIRQIYLSSSKAVCSIQIEYDRNGQPVWSVKHGCSGGTIVHRIKLDYPNEELFCISGYYGPISRDERCNVIKSMSFHTSRGKYGPFGEEAGTFFASTTTDGKVVGLHGRSAQYLDAIGVHMQYWLGNNTPPKPSVFRKFN